MAKKPGTRTEFVLFDVFYEDGSQRSNRKVPSTILGGLDGDAPARAIIEEQDRAIAEKNQMPPDSWSDSTHAGLGHTPNGIQTSTGSSSLSPTNPRGATPMTVYRCVSRRMDLPMTDESEPNWERQR